MASLTTLTIDCMATARRILSSPTAVYSATAFEIVAMAACTVRESTGELPELPVIAGHPAPTVPAPIPASLAASLALTIAAWEAFDAAQHAPSEWNVWLDFREAFNSLKTHFEKEFPNGSHHPL